MKGKPLYLVLLTIVMAFFLVFGVFRAEERILCWIIAGVAFIAAVIMTAIKQN